MGFVVGIDLGTTNSSVSFAETRSSRRRAGPGIRPLPIPQLTGPGEVGPGRVLPSFLYLPGPHEMPSQSLALPWDEHPEAIAGAFARDQGVKVPMRLVSSAKSWLCHGKVDRERPILPWGADEGGVPRLSPVEASSAYLSHILGAWNHVQGREDALKKQQVVLTVPASFDEVARDLTLKAADMAGLKEVLLLEEPLAAFYAWLMEHEADWESQIQPGSLVLVCDVGGGTTDFSLIVLRQKDEKPVFERIAVGDHLILGGDNMDLALARLVEGRLGGGTRGQLRMEQWQSLCYQCRLGKETMLSGLEESRRITLVGAGRQLIAGTVFGELTREEVEQVVLEGFFPPIDRGADLQESSRVGITEFGLPYAQDPAITRHLLRFLKRHEQEVLSILERDHPGPDLILCNGAALKPPAVQQRIRDQIAAWFFEGSPSMPRVLQNPDLDLAVSLGAAYYGLARMGQGVRVESGSPRAYYLGVHTGGTGSGGESLNQPPGQQALCLVERGMEEGTSRELEGRGFSVLANQPVQFNLYSSSFRTGDRVGDLVTVDDTLMSLPPMQTAIRFGKKAGETAIPVRLEAGYTEVGTLALWCRAIHSDHRWRFQFQLRDMEGPRGVAERQVLEEEIIDQAVKEVKTVFGGTHGGGGSPETLGKRVMQIVDLSKDQWPLALLRRLADELVMLASARAKTPAHEARWLNLTGFCLRPGLGDPLDEHRVGSLWKLFHEGPVNRKNPQIRAEWWTLWRRVSGGLTAGQQARTSQELALLLKPGKGGDKAKPLAQEHREAWMALANLERLRSQDKESWGRLLLKELRPKTPPPYWWALSRIGAREPLYGPVDQVVSSDEATRWIETLLKGDWKDARPVGMALAWIARQTGDRKRDVAGRMRDRVVAWLEAFEWSGSLVQMVQEVVPLDAKEQGIMFGESLPSGIQLHTRAE